MSDSLRPHGRQPTRLLCPWDSPGKNTGVGCHALLQGIFPTQDQTLVSCIGRWVLYLYCHLATVEGNVENNVIPPLGNLQPNRGHQPIPVILKQAVSAELHLWGKCLGVHTGERLALREDIMERISWKNSYKRYDCSFDEYLQSKYWVPTTVLGYNEDF